MNNERIQEIAQRFYFHKLAEGFKFQALHPYEDEKGNILYWRIRLQHPETKEKWIRPLHCNKEGQFILKEPAFEKNKPLYHLSQIIQNPDSCLWITEGEWCADKLSALGLIATTSGGVESVSSSDWTPLAKRDVIIWRDDDEAGLRYAHAITVLLKTLSCEIKWVDVEKLNLPPKGDCIDWLSLHPNASYETLQHLPCISPSVSTRSSSLLSSPTSLPFFTVNKKGVFYHKKEEAHWICSPLTVKALVRDKHSENWGRLLEFSDADNKVHRWAMPMEFLKGGGDELRGELMNLGLLITPHPKYRQLLIDYIVTSKPKTRACCVKRTGWYEGAFVLPDKTYGETAEWIIYSADHPLKHYRCRGTLEEWQQEVASLCVGNSRLILAISTAFAAMLLHPACFESGGLHLVGESSSGKTTALKVAASVYGASDYLHRWRATTNGIEALAAFHSDTLLVLDELAQVEPREAGEIAYMLANGSGKARANKLGSARSPYEWRLLFLSAGEIGLSQHMREANKKSKAGQEVRLVDIPADAGKGLGIFDHIQGFESGAQLSKALIEATTSYYGTAAIAFLEKVTHPDTIKDLPLLIKRLRDSFMQGFLPVQASGQVHRVCERFALIAIGGELATRYGITGFKEGEAVEASAICFRAWLEQRGHSGNQERHMLLLQIRSFFETHGESRFTDWNDQYSRTLNRAGFRKSEGERTRFYVLTEAFRNEVCAGLDYRAVINTLREEGWLEKDPQGKPYRREHLPGIGRYRCYVLTHKMWEE